jgi:hypothetical protein
MASRRAPPAAPETALRRAVEVELAALTRGVGLLGAATPRDAHRERARLLQDYAHGRERLPEWTYEPTLASQTPRLERLNTLASPLRALEGSPLGALYQERADELRLEIEAALAVGSPLFANRAEARFAPSIEEADADALAAEWCRTPGIPDRAPDASFIASDDRDPRSLVSRLRAEVARRALPFSVCTSPSMSALAATSGDTLWVAEGRRLRPLDVERTVMHEIEAHALPRTRARTRSVGLFAIGTAGGSDDQEGYALWLEERRGVSGPERRRELGARHEAVTLMRAGADFVAVVRSLRACGVPLDTALLAAERAFRGSNGALPGLGRERVYLEAFVRVERRLMRAPDDEGVLRSGQVAVRAIDALRPWVDVTARD